MHPKIQELVELIETAQSLLSWHGENHWSNWLEKDAHLIKTLDYYGIEHLLTAFGGMGSINDLIIHPTNGHRIELKKVEAVNKELHAILSQIYVQAHKLAVAEQSNS